MIGPGVVMIRRAISPVALLIIAALAATTPARARTTIVPDDFPTIQAALDHLNESFLAETLLVRPGDYHEVIDVSWEPTIRGMSVTPGGEPLVKVAGLRACYRGGGYNGGQRYEQLRFTGPVVVCNTSGPVRIQFRDCRFDADMLSDDRLNYPDLTEISLRRCESFGVTALRAQELYADSSTFHGPLWMFSEGPTFVRDSRFMDIYGTAITAWATDAMISGNLIQGATTGIVTRLGDNGVIYVVDNRIERCAGDGIRADASPFRVFVERNIVTHCGGVGIHAIGLRAARDNRVVDCGGIGLHLEPYDEPANVQGNVVGRTGSHGIVVTPVNPDQQGPVSIQGNTLYACRGAGLVIEDQLEVSLARNLACFNTGAGMVAVRGVPATLTCNDWFGNGGGATVGASPSPTDLAVDPLLCDMAADDAHLQADSPLLDAPGCGRIGALGQGCEPPPVAIAFHFSPQVLNLASRGRWVIGMLEPAAPFAASDIDVASVRLNGVPVDPAAPSALGDHDQNGIPDLTVRFSRVAVARTLEDGHGVTVTGLIGGRTFIGTESVRVTRTVDLAPVENGTSSDAMPAALAVRAASAASGRMRVEFAIPATGPARLELLDIAGRLIESAEVGERGPGRHTLELAPHGELRHGIYFLRLRQGSHEARTRMVVAR